MGDVVVLDVETTLPIPSERVLRKAIDADVRDVVVIGYDENGLLYFAAANPDVAQDLWLLKLAERWLLDRFGPAGVADPPVGAA
jgi:hypothetical protein